MKAEGFSTKHALQVPNGRARIFPFAGQAGQYFLILQHAII